MNIVDKAKRNILFGTISRIVFLVCPFVAKTVIRYVLGAQYLGLNSLFYSILEVLSLSELGFSSAIVYNLYKPVAEGDTKTVNAFLNFYKKAYRIIGIVVLALGLMVLPFLPQLIKGTYSNDINLTTLYLVYLANSSISYFLYAYMSCIIVVHQRDDINSKINMTTKILLTGSQIMLLYLTKNYYLFVLTMPVFTIINNVWLAWMVHKQFPEYKCEGEVPKDKLVDFKKLIAGTFIQRACGITRNALDSICVSAFLGLTLTAIYNNYYYISKSVTDMLGIVSVAFIGGIGNHIVSKTKTENFEELKKIDFVYLTVSGWCATCLICLYQPFMRIWMGEDMLLPIPAVILFVVYFYLLKLGDMRSMYSAGNGLWWEHRWRAISETFLNVILNIVLGKYFGIYGIIAATIISLFLCNYIWSVSIVFKRYFGFSPKAYYGYQLKYSLVNLAVLLVSYGLSTIICMGNAILDLLFRMVICVAVPALLYFLVYRNTEGYMYAKERLRGNMKYEQS